ncbi:VIR protein [Plasmodium vivax]|uniref:VIR protein n=1 Tax=Plasmodium vivax TaxID=5855 RepID=A0A1G4E640_PLAVI|nr:VIR protein [Plasmodium vivax]
MSIGMEYTLDEIKNEYISILNSKFYKIYNEFDKSCDNDYYDRGVSCYDEYLEDSSLSENVITILKNLYSNLYRVYASNETQNNDYFEGIRPEVRKIGCICLKYWLYDQIESKGLDKAQIKELFEGHGKYIKGKIMNYRKNYCNFKELSLNHINMLKNIYALYTVLYNNNGKYKTCHNNKCMYLEYVGKGLDELINGINNCSSNPSSINYCDQLEEFLDLCKKDNEDSGISIYKEGKKGEAEKAGKYLLSVEKYKNEPLYIYLKNEKLLNFLKTSHFLSNKKSTIAATSVVGSAIGLPSIFYYLYKFTPFGSSLRKGKGKNIVNINEEPHNSLLYASDTDKTPYESKKYNVAYHNFSNT